ncbi:uncharacterized protein LOC130372660 isoform X1 [Gadus chalcogrammus]|uniref:uncharacterized protein LOC130372660 isoform X1 n=1 Tax=Gadus chalcogrammus TaxID=1042646 RepID=UPI0024C4E0FB|nr:uncharacterized protein LOC130372660 isoform X1 [Gadus chalcogrammus]
MTDTVNRKKTLGLKISPTKASSLICKTPCLLFFLLTSLHHCSGKFGTPITDDVNKLLLLQQNIPVDYEIPVHYIPKEVSGVCWVVLNIYPLEQSLCKLATMFGALSSNKENIIVFIAMLKSLRFTFDHEELESAMQVFQCHYRERNLLSGLYFDYIKEILHAAAQGVGGFPCKPPPCVPHQETPDGRVQAWLSRSPVLLILVPLTACLLLLLWLAHSRRRRLRECDVERRDDSLSSPANAVPSVCISVPLYRTDDSTSATELVPRPQELG